MGEKKEVIRANFQGLVRIFLASSGLEERESKKRNIKGEMASYF